MIEIELSPRERELIRLWIETMREKSSHWGDGEVILPDEQIVEHKLEGEARKIRITALHLGLVLEWAESSHGNLAFTTDEIMLLEKIKPALAAAKTGAP